MEPYEKNKDEMSGQELLDYISIDIRETLWSKLSKIKISYTHKKPFIEKSVLIATIFRLLLRTGHYSSLCIDIILKDSDFWSFFKFLWEVNDFNELISTEWLSWKWLLYIKWKYYLFEVIDPEILVAKLPDLFKRAQEQTSKVLLDVEKMWISEEIDDVFAKFVL